MQVLHTIAELHAVRSAWRKAGERVAFAPTMGNLHAGHIELVHRARQRAERVIASVFVNPLQFGPKEDFNRYPRTLEADTQKLAGAGCDVLFAPSVAEMYPHGLPLTTAVRVSEVTAMLEGEFRPGHFEGVATVVNVLFNLVQPDLALFGEKDYQQLAVIRRMVRDLHMPLEIVGVPTQRDADGLALSSRNQYLSADERSRAAGLYRALCGVRDGLLAGRRDYAALEAEADRQLRQDAFRPQYVAVRKGDLTPSGAEDREWVVLVAAFLGKTRLIDNLPVKLS